MVPATSSLSEGWAVQDGCLTRVGPAGDIITDGQFENFELTLEWKVQPGGNSGIFYRVSERGDAVWSSGPEMQVLDNALHPDGENPMTSAGSNYALHAPTFDATYPAGCFNSARILADGRHIEYWLNGEKQCEFDIGSPAWNALVARSKFASMPMFARFRKGHIALQDHGDWVWYRNIKIREIK